MEGGLGCPRRQEGAPAAGAWQEGHGSRSWGHILPYVTRSVTSPLCHQGWWVPRGCSPCPSHHVSATHLWGCAAADAPWGAPMCPVLCSEDMMALFCNNLQSKLQRNKVETESSWPLPACGFPWVLEACSSLFSISSSFPRSGVVVYVQQMSLSLSGLASQILK